MLFKTQCQKSSSYILWEETKHDASDTLSKKEALNDGSRIFMGVIEGCRICTVLRCILNPVTGMLIIKGSFKDGQTETQRRKTMCR